MLQVHSKYQHVTLQIIITCNASNIGLDQTPPSLKTNCGKSKKPKLPYHIKPSYIEFSQIFESM